MDEEEKQQYAPSGETNLVFVKVPRSLLRDHR
jgi:hypothetical protein